MEDVREHEAASCVRGYHIYRDIWKAAIGVTFHHSTELRNKAMQLSQDHTIPTFIIYEFEF